MPVPTYVYLTYWLSADDVSASASQSPAPPEPFVRVMVTDAPGAALATSTVSAGPVTTTTGLVASRVPALVNRRNSYDPGTIGIVGVHVRSVTPVPTDVYFTYEPFGAPDVARAIQSPTPPNPWFNVAVTSAPPGTVVALTARVGAGRTMNARGAETPPPGAGLDTVISTVAADAMSTAPIAACSSPVLTTVVGRAAPFQRTTDAAVNVLPVTISVNAGPPATANDGDSPLTTGVGLADGS